MLTAMHCGGGVESTDYNSTLLLSYLFLTSKAEFPSKYSSENGVKSNILDCWGS